jgi:hypothetical protein
MEGFLFMSTELSIRFGFFFGIFILVAVCENLSPRRALTPSFPIILNPLFEKKIVCLRQRKDAR